MSTTLTHNYAHCWDEMYKGVDEQGPYYEVLYLFDDWTQSDAVVNELLGLGTRSGGVNARTTPHQHPLSPNLFCRSARVEGLGGMTRNTQGYPKYTDGFTVRATYRPWEILPLDDPQGYQQIDPTTPILWATQEVDSTEEVVVVHNNNYEWVGGGSAGIPVKFRVAITVMRITFHRVPWIPVAVLRAFRGRINDGIFLGAADQTVLFPRYSTRREFQSDGSIARQVTLEFHEREQPWNKYLRRDTMVWDTIHKPAVVGPPAVAEQFPYVKKPFGPLILAFS